MSEADGKRLTLESVGAARARLRAEGRTLVQCHGCFDIVHPGHLRYLRFAKEQGDVLLVSVSADSVVGKGPDRPYIHEDLRLENLAALEFVDFVLLDEHTWAGPVLELVQPDVYVKGKEYETNRDPRFLRERELVESQGGRVIFSSGDVVFSSTAIIGRYRAQWDLEHERHRFFCERHGLTLASFEKALVELQGRRVLVVGDPILDAYVRCEAIGVASEAPVLSVTPVESSWFVGGAGLIAGQLAALGAEVTMLTAASVDEASERLFDTLANQGVRAELSPATRRPVFVKRRYLVDEQKVFKVDEGHRTPLSSDATDRFLARLAEFAGEVDAVVATDFGYGLFGDRVAEALDELGRTTPVFLDVSGRGAPTLLRLRHVAIATPTEDEIRFAMGDPDSGLSNLAAQYYRHSEAEGLVITMGPRGSILFHPPDDMADAMGRPRLRTDYLPALGSRPAVDAVGAGDVFLSGLVAMSLAERTTAAGLYLGSALALAHVERSGNDPVPLVRLQELLRARRELVGR